MFAVNAHIFFLMFFHQEASPPSAVVLGGTLSTGGKGNVIGTALASLVIGLLRFGLPLCFKIGTQYLDIPVGILLLAVVVGRAMAANPAMAGFFAKLKKKEA